MATDFFVKLWLSERRLIQFVVAIATVTNHVNNDICSPFVSPFNSGFQSGRDGKRVVTIAMKNGAVECLA